MNYIKRMEREVSLMALEQTATATAIREFRTHLTSEKFASDPTIQVGDVDARLLSIFDAATEARQQGEYLMDTGWGELNDQLGGPDWPTHEENEAADNLIAATRDGRWAEVRIYLKQLSRGQWFRMPSTCRGAFQILGLTDLGNGG